MTLPVTLPAATQLHPIPPNSTQLSAFRQCLIIQLFAVIYGSAASDSKSRAPCGYEGSAFAKASADRSPPSFGTIKSIALTPDTDSEAV
jgi:hypothetical protein